MKVKSPEDFIKAYKKYGSIKAISRVTGQGYATIRKQYLAAVDKELIPPIRVGVKTHAAKKNPEIDLLPPEPVLEGKVFPLGATVFKMPQGRVVKRYIFTCAQNNTKIHEPLWENLMALKQHYKAELVVSRFAYMTGGLNNASDKRRLNARGAGAKMAGQFEWDQRLTPYILDDRAEVAPGLMWCGEMNILPTAVRPLSGLEVYTGQSSGIFPHVKLAMNSVPTGQYDHTKFNYTTGTITLRNYIQRKAGQKAEFHHCYGALLVEVDSKGVWFARQLNADSNGTFYDLDLKVEGGKLTGGHRPAAILWGDIHEIQIDPDVKRLNWGKKGILDTLQPEQQHTGDLVDFRSRGHHEIDNPWSQFKRYVARQENVWEELWGAAQLLHYIDRPWCQTVLIPSNHDKHIGGWLRDRNGLKDPVNAEIWLALNARIYERLGQQDDFNVLEEALTYVDPSLEGIHFLKQDESYVICPDHGGGIECGMHGDLGPNGSRGSPYALSRLGRRSNVGHTHASGIFDGLYYAGCSSILNPDWNQGPSAWSHSHVLTYENGKRTILTLRDKKWRA